MKVGYSKTITVKGYKITILKEVEADHENLPEQLKTLKASFEGFCDRHLPVIEDIIRGAER